MKSVKGIFTKKHVVLASLILILAVAVYLNWTLTGTQDDITATANTISQGESSSLNYGDAQYVDKTVSASQYFEEARLNRQTSRDKALSTIEDLLNNADVTTDDKDKAIADATSIAANIESESRIENLVKAKGFSDCIAYISQDQCNLIVKTEGLLSNEAAQIKDIILKESDVPVQNISIVEVNQ